MTLWYQAGVRCDRRAGKRHRHHPASIQPAPITRIGYQWKVYWRVARGTVDLALMVRQRKGKRAVDFGLEVIGGAQVPRSLIAKREADGYARPDTIRKLARFLAG